MNVNCSIAEIKTKSRSMTYVAEVNGTVNASYFSQPLRKVETDGVG